MRLLRFGSPGAEKPGLLDRDGHVRDLSAHVSDFDADALSPAGLAKLAAIDPVSLPQAPYAWDHRSRARASSSASA